MYLPKQSLLVTTFAGCLYGLGVFGLTAHDSFFGGLNLPDNEYGASVFALLYGYPFPAFVGAILGRAGLSALGTNGFLNLGAANSASTMVIRPNTDTVYGVSIQDLSQEDVVLTIPPMQHGRYYSFAWYDPYGDNYATVGSLNHDKSGNYLIRPFLVKGRPGVSYDCEGYVGCVDAPTLNSLMLVRVEFRNRTTDLKHVNHYVNQVRVKGINPHEPLGPPLKPSDLKNLSKQPTIRAFQLLAILGSRNPPQNPILAQTLPWVLRYAGIDSTKGVYRQPASVNLTRVEDTFNKMLDEWGTNPNNNVPLNNGWSIVNPKIAGQYENGKDLVARSFVARFAYLANVAEQTIYPSPAQAVYHLPSNEAYVLTFSGKPPTAQVGFWSLTIYNSEGFLIKNPQKIYSLGDRSNLTYPDGERVYARSSNNATNPHKSFQILVQSSDLKPPKNWTSNWLPSPLNGKGFQLTLRIYAPLAAAINGKYRYPDFKKQKALHG